MEKNAKIKIDATLFDLCLGIFLYGIVCQVVLLFFSRRPEYSIGLWIGVVLALVGSIHMWWTLDRSLEMASKDATKTVGTQYIVRYFILVAAMAVLAVSGFANPLCAFLGYMGMKVSAYMQPFTRKISSKIFKV
ncbi:MAG: ATP synthase subunit I [Clostridium sp.]|nr:ATP synthase subunit I [Clostridium sp.]